MFRVFLTTTMAAAIIAISATAFAQQSPGPCSTRRSPL
jgi:hypothetical protein